MGSDVTPNGLKFQFTDRIKPIGKKQQEMRSAGLDPKDIDLDSLYSAKSGGKSGRSQTHISHPIFPPFLFVAHNLHTNTCQALATLLI